MPDSIQHDAPAGTETIVIPAIAGLMPDGKIPSRMVEECRLALESANDHLALSGLSLYGVTHLVCLVRDMDGYRQCGSLIAEALGPARPVVTLRVVPSLPCEGQRLAFTVRVARG
ncbi:endoribonuclease L-PSP [Acidomonas methanolica]|uniref:endoribonuclease L-PSP n=1 Tax=Acidomonas methanolica TaxID=437 RepID=UPI002119BF4A|nr:endoribonuclease L-PSP [Acidomonas methanolica]MCQ9154242.1 endoribonuclease L-PSP [Acidomonas methanolica]